MVMGKKELADVGKWKDKALNAKGGIILHQNPDVTGHKKMCCDKMMGTKCNCKQKTR